MLFNSLSFGIFLPIVFCIYWVLPHKFRWPFLLAASCYFYMCWDPRFIVLIMGDTLISYVAGRLLERKDRPARTRKMILAAGIILCFIPLFIFKYLNFLWGNVATILSLFAIKLDPTIAALTLPVGISFFTFQTVSYIIDVYKEKVPVERHFGIYATFVTFFPQLVAGPIERTENLLPQIHKEKTFCYKQASYGISQMIWGFFKKLVIADVLAPYVNLVYNNLPAYSGFSLVLATFFFTIQIYCDFSGYSDIAIGAAKLMGIDLMTNFHSPYFSKSVREFWNRWHISLSTWFRDYIYIPLGGNRKGKLRAALNLMITFLVSGLWHGANWTFVLWGGVHGLARALENLWRDLTKKKTPANIPSTPVTASQKTYASDSQSKPVVGTIFKNVLQTLLVFIFCMAAWVFFRANTLSDAFYVFRNSLDHVIHLKGYISFGLGTMGLTHFAIGGIAISLLLLGAYDLTALKLDPIAWLEQRPMPVRILVQCAVIAVILLLFATEPAEFVYFQF